jgi:hypothetical protein
VLLRAEQQLATGTNPTDVGGFLAAFTSAAESVVRGSNPDSSRVFEGASEMSKSAYPLKLPNSVECRWQFVAAAVAKKVGALRTASEFLQQRAGSA